MVSRSSLNSFSLSHKVLAWLEHGRDGTNWDWRRKGMLGGGGEALGGEWREAS